MSIIDPLKENAPMEIPVDPAWAAGALGGLGATLAAVAFKLWSLAVSVGRLIEWRETSDSRHDATELKIERLDQSARLLEIAVAGIPDKVAERMDRRFDEMTKRIDLLAPRP